MNYNKRLLTSTAIYLLPSVLSRSLDCYGITKNDLDKISVRNYDINKPYLDNHIFLMINISLFKDLRIYALQKETNFRRYYFSRIDGVDYIIFVFEIIDGLYFKNSNIYETICLGNVQLLPYAYKKYICKYWDISIAHDDVFDILFSPDKIDYRIDISEDIIPEEAYVETEIDLIGLGI